jgi:hypothetical protein
MSTPRDREGFDDRADDGSSWQEPAHLGGDPATPPPGGADARSPAEPPAGEPPAWEPPGWNLPDASPDRTERGRAEAPVDPGTDAAQPPAPGPQPGYGSGGGLFRARGGYAQVFSDEGDVVGAQGWALQHGWTISDGSGPEDAVLRDLIATAPVRLGKEHRAAGVLRGRWGTLELVAFDVVYASGRYLVPQYAVTAAPLLGAVPALRLSPARLWRHRTGGLVPVASGNEAFDTRWLLLAAEDSPRVRRLAQDPAVQGLLLGTDDGDEFWTGAGHVAAVRPDGHRPQLIEHQARLLAALVSALTAGY